MSLKLQGIASKLAMLQHNIDADAEKLDAAIDAADAKRQAVMPKAVATIAARSAQLADVETFIASVGQVTNGAPAEASTAAPETPVPAVGPYPSYP